MELTSLADLLDLQEIDLQIDRLLDQRQSLPELKAYKAAHEESVAQESERDEYAAELRQLELDLDKAEGELQLLEIKLGEHETRLFAGGMSARETEHMRLEVQSLRGQQGALEERVLGMLEGIDPARARMADIEKGLADIAARKAELEKSIKEQWKVIDAELARKEERKRDALAPSTPTSSSYTRSCAGSRRGWPWLHMTTVCAEAVTWHSPRRNRRRPSPSICPVVSTAGASSWPEPGPGPGGEREG